MSIDLDVYFRRAGYAGDRGPTTDVFRVRLPDDPVLSGLLQRAAGGA